MTKTCEHCHDTFECRGYQCWCGTLGITQQQMDWIAARYKECLCPVCLGKVAAGELGPQSTTHTERAT
ncbi:MAG: cysteine-rich CWC family protein [Nitrospirota bacterium]|nr:cysteine-rich CWC family protein [Nitrospirota bacterium]MDP2384663.1 cysteine-rich CWC family protein [Nitrospirota bacterium]